MIDALFKFPLPSRPFPFSFWPSFLPKFRNSTVSRKRDDHDGGNPLSSPSRKEQGRELNLQFLEDLVNIDSQTKNFAGVNRVQRMIGDKLAGYGFEVFQFRNPLQCSGHLLIARLRGQVPETITFVAHADTVLSPNREFAYHRDLRQGIIRGSGIADNKGGIFVMLQGLLSYLQDSKKPYYSLQVVCSPNEELGSTGLHDQLREIGQNSKFVLGFEPALNDGTLISSRNGNRWYKIRVTGHASHAGRFQEKQLNAAHELSIKISQLHQLNDVGQRIKVNIGSMVAGKDRYNIICGEAEAKLDTRFPSLEEREILHGKITSVLSAQHVRCQQTHDLCTTSFTIEDDCPPFQDCPHSLPYLKLYQQCIADEEGKEVGHTFSGGAADINFMANEQNICIDGLGPYGGGMHTDKEFIYEASLWSRSRSLMGFLHKIEERRQ